MSSLQKQKFNESERMSTMDIHKMIVTRKIQSCENFQSNKNLNDSYGDLIMVSEQKKRNFLFILDSHLSETVIL